MRADRLVALLMLLQARGRMTARDLSEELEVSERTVYRDMEALGSAGVPVYSERGPGGGCGLLDGYKTNLTGLNEAEVRALFLTGASSALGDLGLGKAVEAAMLKLSAALPKTHREGVERLRQRVHLDAAEWFREEEPVPFLPVIQEAVWQERCIDLGYRRSDARRTFQRVEPYGLVAKASVWYFVGALVSQSRVYGVTRVKHARREMRTYRISRILSAEMTDEHFARPDDFDLGEYWDEWCAEFEKSLPKYEVTVRVQPDFLPGMPRIFGEGLHAQIEKAVPDGEGCITLTLTFESREVACRSVLGLGTGVEIVGPEELKGDVLDSAARVVELYSGE